MDIPIIFEDNDYLVVDKPPGIVVNRAETVKELTVTDWASERLGIQQIPSRTKVRPSDTQHNESTEDDFLQRAGIVHRIDKETSGILLLAKNFPAFLSLQKQFKERTIKKTYIALVHGELVPKEGTINAPIGRLPWNRERFGIVPAGKESVTDYKVQSYSYNKHLGEPLSVVSVFPRTGRTHQIRVHFKYINHPLVGDYLYAGRKTSRDDRQWAPRVMLHAFGISFTHPTSGQLVSYECPLPLDMMHIIASK